MQPVFGRSSSAESSNAEKWFQESNNEVRDHSNAFADNDPPFFLRNNSSSSEGARQPDLKNISISNDHTNFIPLQSGLFRLETDGSGTDDFRSVIDDLTIENKKLKRRLKKYEKLHDSHLKDEKLFEVRIHGLPPEKKRELEETLYKFTTSLSNSSSNVGPSLSSWSRAPVLKTFKPGSSQNDSAYASMPESAQGSTIQSGSDSKQNITPTQYLAARRQNIHNYLHDIPEGLFPQQSPAMMTERARMKLVVRRMEQLFSGKDAASTDRQHSIQQQEVSHIAARAERSAAKTTTYHVQPEGSREAHIMDHETEDPLHSNNDSENQSPERAFNEDRPKKDLAPRGSNDHSPVDQLTEQRPTRPLDLDPHREQVPADNIRYMRQMGFSLKDADSSKPPQHDHGWIYLNFLINMAQLHTINVTSDFVRKALGEYSSKFELSNDGRKVRWKGMTSLTRTGGNDETSSNDRVDDDDNDDTPDSSSPRKRPRLAHQDSEESNVTSDFRQARGGFSRPRAENRKHAYTPMFFHRESSDDSDDSSSDGEGDRVCSPLPVPDSGSLPEKVLSGIRTNPGVPMASSRKKHKLDNGPIIFYNNARFCTDLSGDQRSNGNYNTPLYASATMAPLGHQRSVEQQTYEQRGPLAHASELPEPMDLDNIPTSESLELAFLPTSPAKSDSSQEQQPIDLEATGIGGVWPADNFAISVRSRQTRLNDNRLPSITAKAVPHRIAHMLKDSTTKPSPRVAFQKQIVASKVEHLRSSELPPALSLMLLDEESMGEDSDDGHDDESESPESSDALPPATAPLPVELSYVMSDETDEDEDDDVEAESDGEVDFLAAAREMDPETIREREREYDAHMAERLAEEIPAGSSAATAGGGSGFPSPARLATAKRARTSVSMSVAGSQDSSSSDSGSESDDEDMSIRS